jgi:hypothetical protein
MLSNEIAGSVLEADLTSRYNRVETVGGFIYRGAIPRSCGYFLHNMC